MNIGHTLKDHEYIGMCRREVLDSFMRNRAADLGANLINGTVFKLEQPATSDQPYTLHYVQEDGTAQTLEVDVVIGADGANSRIAKEIDAGDYNYAIAYQERIRLPEDKMAYYNELAEMYVGDDVSPDFYAWVFPKYDHVAVGTGTMKVNKDRIRELQAGIRARAAAKLEGGQIIKVEAHPIPEHPRPRRVVGRVALVGDAVRSRNLQGKAFTLPPSQPACALKRLLKPPTAVAVSPPKQISSCT